MQGTDTSAIQRLIGRARRRIRQQGALEGASTAAILAAAAALATIFAMRREWISQAAGIACLAGAALVILAGALLGAARRLDDERVARRIDRASNLSDRLSTAIAFTKSAPAGDDETRDLAAAAIADGVRAVPRADLVAAAPFTEPRDLRIAVVFLVVAAIFAGLALPVAHVGPRLVRLAPDHVRPGGQVELVGERLSPPPGAPLAVFLADGPGRGRPVDIVAWTDAKITVKLPEDAMPGDDTITAWIGDKALEPLPLTVVSLDDERYHAPDAVAIDNDEKKYVESLLAQLRAVAKTENVPELEDYAKTIEKLLKEAEQGKITKEQLLDAMAKAEDALTANPEPNQKEVQKQTQDLGKELAKSEQTKALGEALQKNDLEKAKQELEKLAEKLDQKQLDDKQKQQLGEQLDQAAKQMAKQQKQDEQKQDQQQQKARDEIRRLEKEKQEAKTEPQRQDAERRLQKKKDELQKLEKDQQQKDQSAQRQALKRLQKDMEQAAENLQKKPQQGDQKDQQEQSEQQASQKLKDAARETGKVDQDQRKQATQKKMSSQMDDLREAMQRAKQKGNKGPQDPFNKQAKNQDFAQRSKGGKGNGQSWKPGQGQPGQGQGQKGQGQGQGQQGQGGQGQGEPGGDGDQPGGEKWGTGHDENLTADATGKSGNTKDEDVQGRQGKSGGGTRETILAAAQKGFASTAYQKVYASYEERIEEVMRSEKLPASYKYFVKRYFAKIHPSMEEAPPK